MTSNEASLITYFVSAAGSAPDRIENLKRVIITDGSSEHFRLTIEAVQKLCESALPLDHGYYTRLESKTREMAREANSRKSSFSDPMRYAQSEVSQSLRT